MAIFKMVTKYLCESLTPGHKYIYDPADQQSVSKLSFSKRQRVILHYDACRNSFDIRLYLYMYTYMLLF